MNEKRIISTNTKLLGDKMLNIIDRINLGENPNAGLKDLKDYVYETWKYVAWNNELFFIDLSKGRETHTNVLKIWLRWQLHPFTENLLDAWTVTVWRPMYW